MNNARFLKLRTKANIYITKQNSTSNTHEKEIFNGPDKYRTDYNS